MSDVKPNKARRNLLLVIGVFLLPVIIAKIALNQQWFEYGVTNQGTLVSNELTLEKLGVDNSGFEKQWLLLINVPEACDTFCLQALETLNSTYVLLGKEMPRVTPVTLSQEKLPQVQSEHLRHHKWQQLLLPDQAKDYIEAGDVLIVDPLNNIVLTHKLPTERAQLATLGKAILADMKKLLKYSRIG